MQEVERETASLQRGNASGDHRSSHGNRPRNARTTNGHSVS
jgi:hypothetical protein